MQVVSSLRCSWTTTMLSDLRFQVQGRIARNLQKNVAKHADSLITELLHLAALEWAALGFNRFDDSEVSCTVRLFDLADRIVRQDPKWTLLRLQYDGAQPTKEMRAGRADPNTTPRPDMVLTVGLSDLSVEAKRIGVRSPLPRDYVNRGMLRFVEGKYPADIGSPGIMVGFALRDGLAACVVAINHAICKTPSLGASNQLMTPESLSRRMSRYLSNHGSVRIVHHHLELT
jgi:hypothetical protein